MRLKVIPLAGAQLKNMNSVAMGGINTDKYLPPSSKIFVLSLVAIIMGFLVAHNFMVAVAIITTVIIAIAIAMNRSWLIFEAILLFVLIVPTGWNSDNLLGIPLIINTSVAPQILLPILFSVLVLVIETMKRMASSQSNISLNPLVTKIAMLWLGFSLVSFVEGANNSGLVDALRDLQYILLYMVIIVIPMIYLYKQDRSFSVVQIMIVGLLLHASLSISVSLFPDTLRLAIYDNSMWPDSTRVGFSTSSLFALFIPLCLVLLSNGILRGKWKVVGLLAVALMSIAIFVSQGRVLTLVTVLNTVLVIFGPRLRLIKLNKIKMAIYSLLVAFVLILVGIVLLTYGNLFISTLFNESSARFTSVLSYSSDSSMLEKDLLVRSISNQAAWKRWQSGYILVGEGLGAQIDLYTPGGAVAQRGMFIDNLWATLAVKGGLLAVLIFSLLLITAFIQIYRAAKTYKDERMRLVWRSILFSFPGFIVLTTSFSAHLLMGPSVILTLSTLSAFATVCGVHHAPQKNMSDLFSQNYADANSVRATMARS